MTLNSLIAISLGLSILFLVMTIRRWRRCKWLGKTLNSSITLLLVAASTALLLLASNLYSYQRLSNEQHLADAHIQYLDEQRYQLTLNIPGSHASHYEILGDDWQIDARVLKWHGYANLIGLDLLYQLERLSGRYSDIGQETMARRSAYALRENSQIDLWQLARRYPRWLPFVDAVYGSASYVPLYDKAHYRVFATQSGLIIRPVNEPAANAVSGWR